MFALFFKFAKILVKLAKKYNQLLKAHRFKTNIATSGSIAGVGDVIAQKLVENKKELNLKRSAKMITHSALFNGPVYTVVYKYVNPNYLKMIQKLFKIKKWTKFKRTFTSTLVDTTILNVPLSAASIGVLGMLENKGDIFKSYEKIEN